MTSDRSDPDFRLHEAALGHAWGRKAVRHRCRTSASGIEDGAPASAMLRS
jgi:hypothetical protein